MPPSVSEITTATRFSERVGIFCFLTLSIPAWGLPNLCPVRTLCCFSLVQSSRIINVTTRLLVPRLIICGTLSPHPHYVFIVWRWDRRSLLSLSLLLVLLLMRHHATSRKVAGSILFEVIEFCRFT
jgi:hypothetical protein